MRNIPLDGFRGVFAFIVAFGHYFHWSGNGGGYPVSFVYAVDFFFVLSGYVLTHSIINDSKIGDSWFISFWARRLFRIFPVYYFCTLLGLFATRYLYDLNLELNILRIFQLIFLGQMTGFSDGGNFLHNSPAGVAWSISAEIWVGLFFFPLVHILKSRKFLMLVLSLFFCLVSLITMNRYAPNGMEETYSQLTPFITYGSIRCLLGLSVGYVVYFMSHKISMILNSTFLQCFSIFIIVFFYFKVDFDHKLGLLVPVFSALLIYSFSFNGFLYDNMNNKFWEWLGRLSYSIYLIHPVVFSFFFKFSPALTELNIIAYCLLLIAYCFFLLYSYFY